VIWIGFGFTKSGSKYLVESRSGPKFPMTKCVKIFTKPLWAYIPSQNPSMDVQALQT
jgi:hypothetical protein